jgi:aspartate kinase
MKEVDGIMSADPRRVPSARRLEVLTYEEVAELSYFGAKVLHPVAIHPLRERRIPATIRDVRDPEAQGTRVVASAESEAVGAKALTAIDDVGLLTVAGGGLQGVPGVAGRVFTALATAGVNVLLISQGSSEQSISLVVPHDQADAAASALQAEFELERLKGRVDDIRTGVAIVAVVGDGMRGMPGVAGRTFSALGEAGVNVVLIAQGSSERNISFLVARDDLGPALQTLHDAFELGAAS